MWFVLVFQSVAEVRGPKNRRRLFKADTSYITLRSSSSQALASPHEIITE